MGGDAIRKPPHDLVKFLDLKPAGLEHLERAWQGSLFRLGFIDHLFGEFVPWTAPDEHDRDFPGRADQKGSQIGNSRRLIRAPAREFFLRSQPPRMPGSHRRSVSMS